MTEPDALFFLDIDGVLNHQSYLESVSSFQSTRDYLDPDCVQRLNELVTGDREWVISSTHRIRTSVSKFQDEFESVGFNGTIDDKTPILTRGTRGDEIHDYLKERLNHDEIRSVHDLDPAVVILDDDSDMNPFMECLVRTSFQDGLQDHHIEKANEKIRQFYSGSKKTAGLSMNS